MRLLSLVLLFWSFFGVFPALLHGDDEADPEEIPVVGRPTEWPFSDASGHFRVIAVAAPTALAAQDPLTFTVRVEAFGRVHHPPRPIDLRQVAAFANHFYVDSPENGSVTHPDPQTWEFRYRLRPRSVAVQEVPGYPFVFYNPDVAVPARRFQTLFTDPIPLQVRPRAALQTALAAPESAFQLISGDALLARQRPWTPPGPWVFLILFLLPPLACAGWYLVWRRLYPDAARAARQRRSRAARLALRVLRSIPPAGAAGGSRAAAVVTDYLRQRLDLAVAEPTPGEAAQALSRAGCSPGLVFQALRFFHACDTARFVPEAPPPDRPFAEAARRLILAVEAETWALSRS
jgi:hypothetical protein